jgi:carboxymethylenebutenolidase
MSTQSFTIDVGGSAMPAYLARPDDGGPSPAVIVLQEIFGVNTEIKRITDLVASAGYVGLAINYYHRTHPELNEPYTPEGLQNGFAAAGKLTRAGLRADLEAAIRWLGAQSFVRAGKVGTWGFCMGGSVAYFSATIPGIAAAVAFYGGSIAAPFPSGEPEMLVETPKIAAPVFLAFGGKDAYIPAEAVERIRAELTKQGKRFELHVYPDQDHGFFRHSTAEGDAAKKRDVADVWAKVQTFLKTNLGG